MNKLIRKKTLKEGEIIPLSFDYVFTGIFNDEKNIAIVEMFLSCFLKIPLESVKGHVKIKNRDLPIENRQSKNAQVDFILEYKGELINVELNRNVTHLSKMQSRQLKYGDNSYNQINKTIQINLNLDRKNMHKVVEVYYYKNEYNEILTDKVEIDLVDVQKGCEMWYSNREDKICWLCKILTTTNKEELESLLGDEKKMEKDTKESLLSEMYKYSEDDEVIALYSAYSREELERNTLVEAAEAKGINQTKKEDAVNLYKNGVSKEIITKSLNITEEQLEKYLNEK